MMKLERARVAIAGVGAGLALLGASMVAPLSAFALTGPQTEAQCVGVAGQKLAIRPGQPIALSAGTGTNAGFFVSAGETVHVFCTDTAGTADFGPITDATVHITAVNSGLSSATFEVSTALNGPYTSGATGIDVPVVNSGANAGDVTFFIRSNSPAVTGLVATMTVGSHTETIVNCDSLNGCTSGVTGPINAIGSPAATPELSSIALFGSGALGLGGLAFTRVRSARRKSIV